MFLILFSCTFSATIFVSINGSENNICTISNPCTFNWAISKIHEGDKVEIRGDSEIHSLENLSSLRNFLIFALDKGCSVAGNEITVFGDEFKGTSPFLVLKEPHKCFLSSFIFRGFSCSVLCCRRGAIELKKCFFVNNFCESGLSLVFASFCDFKLEDCLFSNNFVVGMPILGIFTAELFLSRTSFHENSVQGQIFHQNQHQKLSTTTTATKTETKSKPKQNFIFQEEEETNFPTFRGLLLLSNSIADFSQVLFERNSFFGSSLVEVRWRSFVGCEKVEFLNNSFFSAFICEGINEISVFDSSFISNSGGIFFSLSPNTFFSLSKTQVVNNTKSEGTFFFIAGGNLSIIGSQIEGNSFSIFSNFFYEKVTLKLIRTKIENNSANSPFFFLPNCSQVSIFSSSFSLNNITNISEEKHQEKEYTNKTWIFEGNNSNFLIRDSYFDSNIGFPIHCLNCTSKILSTSFSRPFCNTFFDNNFSLSINGNSIFAFLRFEQPHNETGIGDKKCHHCIFNHDFDHKIHSCIFLIWPLFYLTTIIFVSIKLLA